MALTEAKADYTPFIIDVHNKPALFVEKLNPIGRVGRIFTWLACAFLTRPIDPRHDLRRP